MPRASSCARRDAIAPAALRLPLAKLCVLLRLPPGRRPDGLVTGVVYISDSMGAVTRATTAAAVTEGDSGASPSLQNFTYVSALADGQLADR